VLGLGSAARGYARALTAAGVGVCTLKTDLPSTGPAGRYGRERYHDRFPDGEIDAELICINAEELPWFMTRFGDRLTNTPRIGVWAWETDRIPARWKRSYQMLDEIWVNSRFMAENIGAASPIPVLALPPAVTAPSDRPPLRLGVPDGFLYLFMFDYYSTVQRKNPVGLIEAFSRAFADGEGPRLLIKTFNAPQRPIDEEQLLWAIGDRSDIHLVDASLTAEERDAVLAACDCYVSLHRSEGFGLTLAEAMAAGKPVIGTRYSGNLDFMNERNSFLVDYTLTRVGPDGQIYPADGTWAEPDLDHAAALLRRVYDDPDGAARIAHQAREDIARELSEQAAGQRMRRRLQELIAAPATAR
jgi:glycosyltransferase involved in cell wall biosynthesis